MKILRKCIAFALAIGLMVSAMTVFADNEYSYKEVDMETADSAYINSYDYSNGGFMVKSPGGITSYYGLVPPTNANTDDFWLAMPNWDCYNFDGTYWVNEETKSIWVEDSPSAFNASASASVSAEAEADTALTPEDIAAIQSRAEAEAVQHAASDEGFEDVGDMFRAAEKGMSAGEFYNNVVVSTPGIENAMTVGQGGNLVVNGKVTNMSATISKVTNRAYVDSVRIEQEGTVLNVVDVSYPAVEATINFYTPGITDGMEIVALQYNAGTWVNVEVAEVRADHVVLNMKGNGVVAFIAK